jgi:Kef-type K+ transport system membrane component KefB
MPHLPILLLQICVIVVVARTVGLAFKKIEQPQVMGEMFAGILLGPSVFGWLAPDLWAGLFPPESLGFLNSLSQIGLVLFMFMVGLELNPQILKGRKHLAILTSHVSIILPFLFGSLLALYLYPRLSDDSVKFMHFALFLGTAMSITAFPVLARILTERKMLRTQMGAVAIACAAVDDVTAWCILAGVIIVVRATGAAMPFWMTLAGSAVYIAIMLIAVRALLRNFERVYHRRGQVTQDALAMILVLVLGSAWVTELLGIHALFGAFLIGVIMPKDEGFVSSILGKLWDSTIVLLLPLFFAFTGLRTRIGLLSGAEMWLYCAIIIAVAIAGKLGGSMLSAKLSGMSWREAGALGILMNTRGLMELVVLNIGLDIKVISPAMFAMMVLMALTTTFMTTPLLAGVYPIHLYRKEGHAETGAEVLAGAGLPKQQPDSMPNRAV